MAGPNTQYDMHLLLNTTQQDLIYSDFEIQEAKLLRKAFKIKARKQEVMVHLFVAEEDGNLFGTINVRNVCAITVSKSEIEYDYERLNYRKAKRLSIPPYELLVTINVVPSEERENTICADIEIEAPIEQFKHPADITKLIEILYNYVRIVAEEEYDRIIATGGR